MGNLPGRRPRSEPRAALRRHDDEEPGLPHDRDLLRRRRAPAAARVRGPARARVTHPGLAQDPVPLVHPDVQHPELHGRCHGDLGGGSFLLGPLADRRSAALAGSYRCPGGPGLRARQPARIRDHAAPCARAQPALDLHVRIADNRRCPGLPRGRGGRLLGRQSLADRVRSRSAPPRPPLAQRPGAPGGSPRRSEDRSLQRPVLRLGARRGARRARSASSAR